MWLEGQHLGGDRPLDLLHGHHRGAKFGIQSAAPTQPLRSVAVIMFGACLVALPSLRMRFRAVLRSLLLCSALSLPFLGFAQPKKVQPGKARVLLYKERMAAQFDTVDVVKNVLKINPLLFFRGEIPLYYERAISPNVSLEVGLGVTLRNYMALSFTGDDADDFGAGTEIIANPSYHIAARFYFVHDLEPQGLYLQPGYSHLVYSKDIGVRLPDGSFSDEKYRDERTFNDLRLLLGYQSLSVRSNWLFDVYVGAAFRDRRMLVVEEMLNLVTDEYTYKVEERNDRVPAFFLGIRAGLGW
jgi:hypothetical protein